MGVTVSYLSHTQPLTLLYSSSQHCTEPVVACPDLSLSHSLWSNRIPHPASCSPLTTHKETHRHTHIFGYWDILECEFVKDNIILMWYSLHWWWKWWWDDGMMVIYVHLHKWWMVWRSLVLTALQLQRAHLSVHGVLGQVHVAGNCCGDAAHMIIRKC